MPLIIEVRLSREEDWKWMECLIPGDPPTSVRDLSAAHSHQLYVVRCSDDDGQSVVYRLADGIDLELGDVRFFPADMLVEHAVISDGAVLEMTVLMEGLITPVHLRLRHIKINFGGRLCKICNQIVPASELGRHAKIEHGPSPENQWPGGPSAWLEELRQSLLHSIEAADGFPRITERLRWSLDQITAAQRTLAARLN